jgi:hypothetical protein
MEPDRQGYRHPGKQLIFPANGNRKKFVGSAANLRMHMDVRSRLGTDQCANRSDCGMILK